MSSNLLEFQRAMVDNNKATFNIETSKLNPKNIKTRVVEDTKEEFEVVKYTIRTLREFILKHSFTIATTDSLIQGEIKEDKVILTILKIE